MLFRDKNQPRCRVVSLFLGLSILGIGVSGCSQSADLERESWLLKTLVDDHFHLMAREPELVSGKFRKMTGDHLDGTTSLYPYFRGTLSQMYRDLSGDYDLVVPTIYSSPESALVLMVGDPHLENVSVMVGDRGVLRLDWDDFDGAGYGPWIWDLRRLALSFWVLAHELNHLELSSPLVKATVHGYLHGVSLWKSGQRIQPEEGQRLPQVIRDLFSKARSRLNDGRIWQRYTEVRSDELGQNRLYLRQGVIRKPEQAGVIRDALLPLNDRERLIIEEVTRSLHAQGLNVGQLKDSARRYGQGVSSYPLMRFYLLFEGPSSTLDDDQLWEVKELGDRPVPSGLSLYPPRQFGAQGERVVQARRDLQWGPHTSTFGPDPTTWVDVNSASFRVRLKSDLHRGLNLTDLTQRYQELTAADEEDIGITELIETAELLGALLAGAHCFAPTLEGDQGGFVIDKILDVAGRSELASETLNFVHIYGQVIRRDRSHLSMLLEQFGPHLGAHGAWHVQVN